MARKGKPNNRGPNGLTPAISFMGYIHLTERWSANVERAAVYALEQAVESVMSDAKATTSYTDDTGATRASTVAYVQSHTFGRNPIAEHARSIAGSIRPGSASDEPPPAPVRGTVELVAYSATDYSYHLNIRDAGESMYLSDAVLGNSGLIGQAIAEAFEDLMKGEMF